MSRKKQDINQNKKFSEIIYKPYTYPIFEWESTVEGAIEMRLRSYDVAFAITHSVVFQGLPVTAALYKMHGKEYFYIKYDYSNVDEEITRMETTINRKFITNEKADKAFQIFGQELLTFLQELKWIDQNKKNNDLIDMRVYQIEDYLVEMLDLLVASDFEKLFLLKLELDLIQTYESERRMLNNQFKAITTISI